MATLSQVDRFLPTEPRRLGADRLNEVVDPLNAVINKLSSGAIPTGNLTSAGGIPFQIAAPIAAWPGYYRAFAYPYAMISCPQGGGLVETDFGPTAKTTGLIIVNMAEVNGAGHILPTGYGGVGLPRMGYSDAKGKPSDGPNDLNGYLFVLVRVDSVSFNAYITDNVQIGSNKQWQYGWQEIYKAGAGLGNWQVMPNGRSGDSSDTTTCAYNRLEDINALGGQYGIGITPANIPTGFSLQPIPGGTPVRIEVIINDATGQAEYWFSVPNGIDGTCG